MALEGQQLCFLITFVSAIVATLVYVFLIKPNIAGYSPAETNCINQSVRKCRNSANVMERMKCMRESKRVCMQGESYTSTSMIKSMMVQKMPHGLSTSDNRNVFKKESCGGM